MRITVDTNILVRVTVVDDPEQASLAAELLRTAELIAIPLSSLCEFVWVTMRAYRRAAAEVIQEEVGRTRRTEVVATQCDNA